MKRVLLFPGAAGSFSGGGTLSPSAVSAVGRGFSSCSGPFPTRALLVLVGGAASGLPPPRPPGFSTFRSRPERRHLGGALSTSLSPARPRPPPLSF